MPVITSIRSKMTKLATPKYEKMTKYEIPRHEKPEHQGSKNQAFHLSDFSWVFRCFGIRISFRYLGISSLGFLSCFQQ